MAFLIGFAKFWYDFIIGDDPTIAIAVVIALILTSFLARANPAVWWVLPAVVILVLGASLWRAARS